MAFPFRVQEAGQLPRLPLNRRNRARLRRRNRTRYSALERAARKLVLDPMEPRVLLSADVLALDLATFYQEQQNHDLLVRLQDQTVETDTGSTTVQRVEILDMDGGQILSFGDLSEITSVSILGTSGDETVTFDATSFESAAPFNLSFVGGAGSDSVEFLTGSDVAWTIDGYNEGSANDGFVSINFQDVEWALGWRVEFLVETAGLTLSSSVRVTSTL